MVRSILISILLVAATTIVVAQWTTQTSGTSALLRSVHFADASNGWAVGANGTIRYTTNGGNQWGGQTSGVTDTLYSVHFPQMNNGWIVGERGVILHTTNNGAQWVQQASGVMVFLRSIWFEGVSNGWIAGYTGTILHTTNGGSQWTSQPSGTTNALFSISFADLSNGWAIGNHGTIVHTTNGGTQWTVQSSGTATLLRSVYFVDANNGWVVGDGGTILRTTNGGSLWTAQPSGTTTGLYAIYAADANNVWIAGIGGTILRTMNGGSQWNAQSSGATAWLTSLNIFGASNGWAVGDVGTITHTIVTNQVMITVGMNPGWNLISNPLEVTNDSVRALFPTSFSSYAFAYSGGYLRDYTMENGTGYWNKLPTAVSQSIIGLPRTRDTINVLTGWNMVGTISNPVDTNTIVSIPSGLRVSRWFGYSLGYTAVTQLIPGMGYWVKASGAGKFILANPLDNPPEIQAMETNALDLLSTLTITDSKGGSQTLYFGADAKNEVQQHTYAMPPLPPVGAFDARFETADGGSMVVTNQNGATGFSVAIQSDAYPLSVRWKMAGSEIYELTDGLEGKVFRSKEMNGEGRLSIANSAVNRIVLNVVAGNPLPGEFALSQNYPNPFNPVTTIMYTLPTDTRVSLRLFNVLGQEVATLVNEEQKAGDRSVEWTPMNVASGTYYYRLEAGGFVQTKKLLLLK